MKAKANTRLSARVIKKKIFLIKNKNTQFVKITLSEFNWGTKNKPKIDHFILRLVQRSDHLQKKLSKIKQTEIKN